MGGEVSTDFKSKGNWNISISSSAIEIWVIPGVPPGGGQWVDDGGGWWVGAPHTHAHAVHTSMHTCVWHHREFPGIPPMGVAIYMKLSCLTCMPACACVRMHVHICGGHPQPPPTPSIHPHSCREPKIPKFNKSWTNRDNSILFEDSLPLNIPELI